MLIRETRKWYGFAHMPLPKIDASAMQCPEGRSVTDRNNRRTGQPLAQQPIGRAFRRFVERSSGLIKKQPIGLEEYGANDCEALLLTEGKPLLPMSLLVETPREGTKPTFPQQ